MLSKFFDNNLGQKNNFDETKPIRYGRIEKIQH